MAYKIPQQLFDIPNPDKTGWTEKWTDARAKDLANFPHPSRICLIGPPSVGKSFMMKHLLLHQRPMFQELYIIHGDSTVTREFDDLEATMLMDEFPPVEFYDSLVKTLVIIDDVEFSHLSRDQVARMNKLVRYVSSHKNVTVYVSHQSFVDLPILIRKLCNVFIIWKPRSLIELKLIANRIALHPEQMEDVFENHCNQYRDSLCVDLHFNTPAMFRKNVFTKIDLIPLKVKKEKKKKDQ
jgi:GTPase SAR1 family protein